MKIITISENYKGYKIDYKDCGAIIVSLMKCFASDEIQGGKSGLAKAKNYIDNIK